MPFYCGKRSARICVVLGPKKSSTYSSEYASGFFAPAASHLPAAPLPRNERLLEQTPWGFGGPPASGLPHVSFLLQNSMCSRLQQWHQRAVALLARKIHRSVSCCYLDRFVRSVFKQQSHNLSMSV